jgi:hypothetical protein
LAARPPSKHPVGYVILPRMIAYIHQDGRHFHLVLGRSDALGLTATKRSILRARAPRLRGARRWLEDHLARHGLDVIFDR